jgi:hypothetical protein
MASRPPRRREDRSSGCATECIVGRSRRSPGTHSRRIAAPSSGLCDEISGPPQIRRRISNHHAHAAANDRPKR